MNTIQEYLKTIHPTLAGKFLYYCLPYRKRTVLSNMRQVFGNNLSKSEINYLSQCFYSHLATSLKENFFMRFMTQKEIAEKAEVIGYESALEIAKTGKGLLVLTGHFGNWEFAPVAGILNFKQFKGSFYFIRKMLKPKWLERKIFNRYYLSGLNVIPKKNSLAQVCDVLEKNNAVVFVMDQYASLPKDGVSVEFFGKKTGTYRSLATIARYTNVPVIPVASYRKPNGQHVLKFYEAIPWVNSDKGHHEEIRQNTLLYNQALERLILEHPEQWLWTHKRWK
jgi:Kdo2-lipid IVA lauroyltransferase/acyltransferase